MTKKTCTKCKETYDISNFHKRSSLTNKYANYCKKCVKKYKEDYRAKNKDMIRKKDKEWREKNKEHKKEQSKNYYKINPERVKEWHRREKERLHERGITCPIEKLKNKRPGLWLGIYVAEPLLSAYFGNAVRMPFANPGFDYICTRGYKIDVKASIIHRRKIDGTGGTWSFQNINDIADYFFCIGFDDHDNLNVMKVWLFPQTFFHGKKSQSIPLSKMNNFRKYELDTNCASEMCILRKGEHSES